MAARRIEPRIAAAKTEHLLHAVGVVQFAEQRTDDVIQARTQPAAGDNPRPSLGGIEK